MNCLFGANGIYTKFKTFRNQKVCQFEGTFFLLNALLFLMSWILVGLGFRLTGSKILASLSINEFQKIHDSMVIFNSLITIILVLVSFCGFKVSIDRNSPNMIKGCYFISLIFFVGIPLLTEGSFLLRINSYDVNKIEQMC